MDEKVQGFLDTVPPDKRPLFDKLQGLILSLYPDARIALSYGVPTYRAGTGWVALGLWKRGVSVYPHGRLPVMEFRQKHPEIKTSTGTINFKLTDSIPVDDLKQTIRHAMEHPKTP
jgi:uncharacterized protein YdhG (YjbR/CyaY superfamily)